MDPSPDEFDLPPGRAEELLGEGRTQFIDVRESYEWEAGRMPGSRWIPWERLAEEARDLDPQQPIVFVCRVGGRSAMVANSFRRAGFPAYNLAGGLEAWVAAGLPLDPPGGQVAPH